MSKKLAVVILCLILVLLTLKKDNRGLKEAQTMLISRMSENERVAEVFAMNDGGVET